MVFKQAAGRSQAFKRDVYIRDDSGTSVNVTLWGAYCTTPGDQLEEVRLQPPHCGHEGDLMSITLGLHVKCTCGHKPAADYTCSTW